MCKKEIICVKYNINVKDQEKGQKEGKEKDMPSYDYNRDIFHTKKRVIRRIDC